MHWWFIYVYITYGKSRDSVDPMAGSSPGKSKVSIFGDTILVGADRDSLNGKKVRFLKHLRKVRKIQVIS